jgi:hypothetical protein
LPYLKSLNWDENGWKRFTLELQGIRAKAPTSVDATIAEIAKYYAEKVDVGASGYMYYGGTANNMASRLEFCFKIGGIGPGRPATTLLGRIIETGRTSKPYIESTLLGLVPEFKRISAQISVPLSTEPFASALRSIFMLFANKVMGPKPDSRKADDLGPALRRWTCNCGECNEAKRFLLAPGDSPSIRISSIGAPKRKHVEGHVRTYVPSFATADVIQSRPQGVMVGVTFMTQYRALKDYTDHQVKRARRARSVDRESRQGEVASPKH